MTISKKLRRHKWVAGIIILLGFLTLLYGIIVEDEPTAVALLLIGSGAAWYFIVLYRAKSMDK